MLNQKTCLQALGVAVDIGPEGVARCIQECGVGFMFAPRCGSSQGHRLPAIPHDSPF